MSSNPRISESSSIHASEQTLTLDGQMLDILDDPGLSETAISTTESNVRVARFLIDQTVADKIRGVLMSYHEIRPGVGCVGLIGRLDVRHVPQIERLFEFMTATQKRPVVVDLSGVELLNSIGLALLISNANSLSVHKAAMILLNPQPRVERVIRMACLDQLLPIVYSVAEALRKIKAV